MSGPSSRRGAEPAARSLFSGKERSRCRASRALSPTAISAPHPFTPDMLIKCFPLNKRLIIGRRAAVCVPVPRNPPAKRLQSAPQLHSITSLCADPTPPYRHRICAQFGHFVALQVTTRSQGGERPCYSHHVPHRASTTTHVARASTRRSCSDTQQGALLQPASTGDGGPAFPARFVLKFTRTDH